MVRNCAGARKAFGISFTKLCYGDPEGTKSPPTPRGEILRDNDGEIHGTVAWKNVWHGGKLPAVSCIRIETDLDGWVYWHEVRSALMASSLSPWESGLNSCLPQQLWSVSPHWLGPVGGGFPNGLPFCYGMWDIWLLMWLSGLKWSNAWGCSFHQLSTAPESRSSQCLYTCAHTRMVRTGRQP